MIGWVQDKYIMDHNRPQYFCASMCIQTHTTEDGSQYNISSPVISILPEVI